MDNNSIQEDAPLLLSSAEEDHERESNQTKISMDKAIQSAGFGFFHYAMVFVMGWANSADAIEILSVSYILPAAKHELHAIPAQTTFISAVGFAGMMIGSFIWGSLADVRGRKITLLICQSINALFTIGSAFSQDLWFFGAMRFFSGIGVGGTNPLIFVYAIELLPADKRGRMIGLLGAAFMVGQILVAGLAWLIIPHLSWGVTSATAFSFNSWRIFLLCSAFPVTTSLLMFLWFPESPRFLISKGRNEEAVNILKWIHTKNNVQTEFYPDMQIEIPEEAFQKRSALKDAWRKTKHIFTEPVIRRNFLFSSAMLFCLSFSYYGLTTWFPTMIQKMESAHASSICGNFSSISGNGTQPYNPVLENKVYFESFLQAAASLPGNIIFYLLIDRIGRKWFLGGSMILSAAAVFLIYVVKTHTQSLVITCVFAGINVVAWNASSLLTSEVFPTDVRTTARGIQSGAVNRLGAILANVLFGSLSSSYCSVPILTCSVLLAIGAILTFFIPNTTKADIK